MEVKVFAKVLRPKPNFWSKPVESLDSGVEAEINAWLASNPNITVKEIKQSMSGGSGNWMTTKIVISIWFEYTSRKE
ncbi:MAG: hypothetical protein JKY88_12465 [Pseudomonadales bacterium]|nr:hypothetical protein [Pseudomonadales bacterium]